MHRCVARRRRDPDRPVPRPRRWLAALGVPLALALVATGCTLKADVAATGGASGNVTHLWVTLEEVWLASGADTPPEATAGWVKTVLPAPITFDLATLSPATLTALATAISVPAGTYRQVHLVTADSGDTLASSAAALGLGTNSQLSVTDAAGTSTTSPLESPVPGAGAAIVPIGARPASRSAVTLSGLMLLTGRCSRVRGATGRTPGPRGPWTDCG